MSIQLSAEQEQRIRAVIGRGSYDSVEEFVEAALVAVEHRGVPDFEGSEDELEVLLSDGLRSGELTESEFWDSVNKRTDALLAEHRSVPR